MPCYHPMDAWRPYHSDKKLARGDASKSLIFKYHPAKCASLEPELQVPCGQCVGCRLERSRQWAIRCVHEASLHERNCFITLTYNNENLPKDESLHVRHFQLFMKKLRKKYGKGIRFYHCGEYGENFGRPHYHALLFGFDFSDKILFKQNRDYPIYTSKALSELWTYGYASIGSVTFEFAAYVARYVMKKILGEDSTMHYSAYDKESDTYYLKKPEYTTMSRRPGIGRNWLEKYQSDVYPSDQVIMRGKSMKPPKFYDANYPQIDEIKFERELNAEKHLDNNTPERLAVREAVHQAQISILKRSLT